MIRKAIDGLIAATLARGDLKRGSTPASGNLSKHKSGSASQEARLRRHHDAHEICRVPRSELLHDVGAG